MAKLKFDYYHGVESDQFTFIRIPKLLFMSEELCKLSNDAKILYGLMMDKLSLSRMNNWFDENNRPFIIFTVQEAADELGVARSTCTRFMTELEEIGLIEKRRMGLGDPDIIYVKNIASAKGLKLRNNLGSDTKYLRESSVLNRVKKKTQSKSSRCSKMKHQDDSKRDVRKNDSAISADSNISHSDDSESATNNTNINKTINNANKEYTSNHIYQDKNDKNDEAASTDILAEIIKQHIGYYDRYPLLKRIKRERFDEMLSIILDVVCYNRKTISINNTDYPYSSVRDKFMLLTYDHLEYVYECIDKQKDEIKNIRKYIITALFNSIDTIAHYYSNQAEHDLNGLF